MSSAVQPVARAHRRGLAARLWGGLRLRDALIVTALPLTGLLLLLGATLRDYLRYRQFDDWWTRGRSVAGFFQAHSHALAALPTSLSLRRRFQPEAPDAGIIRLDVPGTSWDSLEANPQANWGRWVHGVLRYGQSAVQVRLRKRGDNSIHWLTDKRTLTVRTPRDDFYKRFRTFALSIKDVLPSYVANRMASEFDLLAPETEVVPVYLNNRFVGMYRFVEVVDESFLRPFDRMPGNIFRGDAAERGEYHKAAPRNLFANPYLWDRVAVNDRWTSAGPGQLRLLLEDLAGGTFEDHQRLMRRLDRDEWSRMFAYLAVVGDPFHMDGVHNQLIYEDPSTQFLHPIPWDVELHRLGPGLPLNDLYRAVLSDPFVVDGTMRELARRVDGDSVLHVVERLAHGAEDRYRDYFEYDRLRTGLVPDVGDADDVVAAVRANVAQLHRWLETDEIAYSAAAGADGLVLDFETHGLVGSDLTGFRLQGSMGSVAQLRLDTNRNGIPDSGDRAVRVTPTVDSLGPLLRLEQPVALYAGWDTRGGTLGVPDHLSYRLFLSGVPRGTDLTPVLTNRATGRLVSPVPLSPGTIRREGLTWHPWLVPLKQPTAHRLSGTVRLTSTLRIPAGDTLLIEAGTTLLLGPDVSIVSSGRLLALGTESQPIRILPLEQGRPWGTFSVQGPGADSSIVRYAEIAEGGGGLVDRIEYTGMVNLHRASGVVFEHVTFRDNLRSDDTFHALHSRFYLRHSHFIRANSDAIDLDISSGEIVDNRLEDSGGDAIDLMTSTPWIEGNRITGSGDKGISVGEASRPFIFNNVIDSCDIGIEVKDRSEPVILNNLIETSRIGLRERRKNWRYGGGGWATVAESRFRDNRIPRVRDQFSRLTLAGVAGLDSAGSSAVAGPGDTGWLYRMVGIVPVGESGPGPLSDWRRVAPASPLDEASFRDDFGAASDGWVAGGGVSRIEKRRDALVLEVDRQPGVATRAVDWSLPAGGTLVLELAGRDILDGRVKVSSVDGVRSVPFEVGADPATARFVTLELPAGHYTSLALELEAVPGLSRTDPRTGLTVPRDGRLDLRTYRVVPDQVEP